MPGFQPRRMSPRPVSRVRYGKPDGGETPTVRWDEASGAQRATEQLQDPAPVRLRGLRLVHG